MLHPEKRLISRLFRADEKEVAKFFSEGLLLGVFRLCRREMKYLLRHYRSHGCVPDWGVFKERFRGFGHRVKTKANLSSLLEEVRDRHKGMVLQEIAEMAQGGSLDDPERTWKELTKRVSRYSMESVGAQIVNVSSDGIGRYHEMLERRKQKGMSGVATGWPGIDQVLLGLGRGRLVTLGGLTWVGKTWIICYLACQAWRQKEVPMIVSKEMNVSDMLMRVDSILAGVPFDRLRRGTLKRKQRKSYLRFFKDKQKSEVPFYVIGDDRMDEGSGPLSLRGKFESLFPKPTILLVDGAYMLDDDRGGGTKVEKLVNLSRDLKRLARDLDVPLVASLQLKGSAESKGFSTLEDVAWSRSWSQDSDDLLEVRSANRAMNLSTRTIKILKCRQGQTAEVEIGFDLEGMDFSERVGAFGMGLDVPIMAEESV